MPAPSWDNFDDFMSTDDFAVVAVITPHGGAPRNVNCIFDAPYLNAELGEYTWDGSLPRIMAKETDFAGMTRTDSVFVNGVQYYALTNPQEDGTGMAVLTLSAQA